MWFNYRFNDRSTIKCPRCLKFGTPTIRWVKSRNKDYDPYQSKYYHLYIGHYSGKRYREQMLRYRARVLKSRPNGRVWCYLKEKRDYLVRTIYPDTWLLIRDESIEDSNESVHCYRKVVTLEEVEDEEDL